MKKLMMSCLCCLVLLFTLRDPLCAQAIPLALKNAASFEIDSFSQDDRFPSAPTGKADSTTWKTIIPDTVRDQKRIFWEFPRNLARKKHWVPTAAFLGVTGALIGLDQYSASYFRRTSTYHGLNRGLSGTNTSLIIAGTPAAIYLTGFLRKNSYGRSTALLTAEALVDSEIAAEVLKLASRRARPESISLRGNFADTWLDSGTITAGGFPSGHSIAAFSVANVVSRRYGGAHRWVPYLAYGAAAAIGFSRVTLSAHDVSDVFAGAALGYAISRFVALDHHCHKGCSN